MRQIQTGLAALAGVLIATTAHMIKPREMLAMIRRDWVDACVLIATFVVTVFVDLITAVAVGVAVEGGLHAVVGEGSLIAAGAVVGEGMEIPPHSLVLGVPAKVRGPLNDEQRARVADGHKAYVALAARHRAGHVERHR